MRKNFPKLLKWLAGALAASLCVVVVACSTVNQAVPPAPNSPQQIVFELKAGLISAEDLAVQWANHECTVPASCKDQRVTDLMKAVVSADTLINAAETAVRENATAPDVATKAINDAQAALTALQLLLQQYGVTTATTKGA